MQIKPPPKPPVIAMLVACVLPVSAQLPRPDQVDKPENIQYIVPDPSTLPGIVVDNTEAVLLGQWKRSVHTPPFVGVSYIHDMKEAKGEKSATFTPDLPHAGRYQVRMSHNSNIRRANTVPVTIRHAKGETTIQVDEGQHAPINKLFRPLGIFEFKKGRNGSVTIGNARTEGKYVIVDSIQFIPVTDGPSLPKPTQWKTRLPVSVTSFGACREGGHLYVYAGHKGQAHVYSAASHSKVFARLNLNQPDEWEALPFNKPLQGFGMTAWDAKIYLSGGSRATNPPGTKSNLSSVDEVAVYDLRTQAWMELPVLPEPRSSHEMVAHGGHLYIIGGWHMKDGRGHKWHHHGLVADLSKKPIQWEKLPETRWAVRANAAAIADNQLHVIGGLDTQGVTNAVHKLNLETLRWSDGPDYPGTGHLKAFGAAACLAGTRLIACAYSHQPRILTQTGWAPTPRKLEERRFFHRMIPLSKDKVLFLGGASHDGHLDTLEVHGLPTP